MPLCPHPEYHQPKSMSLQRGPFGETPSPKSALPSNPTESWRSMSVQRVAAVRFDRQSSEDGHQPR